MKRLTIHGHSDDLIELSGALTEEFGSVFKPFYIRFTNGALVFANYGPGGYWRIALQEAGSARLVSHTSGGEDASEKNPGLGEMYSDILVIEAAEWVIDSTGNTPPDLSNPQLRKAREILAYLEERDVPTSAMCEEDRREAEEEIAAIIAQKEAA